MLRLLFPEVPVHVHPSPKDDLAARVNRAAARVVKGAVSWYRALRLWSGGASPRVLVVSRANAWDGVRDREMASTLDALRAEGMEPLVLEQSHGTFAGQWRGLWERPASHLFGDLFHLQYRIHGPRSMPMRQPISHVPLMFEGIDLRPLAEAFVTAQAEHQAREHDTYLQVLPNWLRRWGVSVVVTCDENGGEHALKAAALLAGVPVIAVQHGCIHAHHLHYAYPQHCTPEDIPLASITCVYGEHEQGLLAALGIYASESIEVTGQPQNDLRDHVERPWGERGAAGTRLRDDAMQDTGGTLLLLTSQDLYHGLAAEVLLPALQACPDSVKLVVRPHPREGDGAHWQDYFATYGVSERAVVVANGKLEYWLDACDVHVSVCSTVLAEAAVWGRPSLVLAPRAVGDWLGVLEAGVAIPFDQGADLQTALADVDAATSAFQVARSNYIQRHFGALDGKTGRRIAAIIRHSISIS
ncbi:MAG: hypothetical protein GC168_01515 [Candidatus Hydrogenedens sp.]|nr:hypothetical protein [Candidatus Hydrogenedens sp.]